MVKIINFILKATKNLFVTEIVASVIIFIVAALGIVLGSVKFDTCDVHNKSFNLTAGQWLIVLCSIIISREIYLIYKWIRKQKCESSKYDLSTERFNTIIAVWLFIGGSVLLVSNLSCIKSNSVVVIYALVMWIILILFILNIIYEATNDLYTNTNTLIFNVLAAIGNNLGSAVKHESEDTIENYPVKDQLRKNFVYIGKKGSKIFSETPEKKITIDNEDDDEDSLLCNIFFPLFFGVIFPVPLAVVTLLELDQCSLVNETFNLTPEQWLLPACVYLFIIMFVGEIIKFFEVSRQHPVKVFYELVTDIFEYLWIFIGAFVIFDTNLHCIQHGSATVICALIMWCFLSPIRLYGLTSIREYMYPAKK